MILNLTTNSSIAHAIPLQVLTGVTPDISPILQFEWYEPVYYKEEESHFPSMSKEKSGRFVGVAEHVGHALTFMILTDDTQKIIYQSVVRTATDTASQNLRARSQLEQDPYTHVHSFIDEHINDDGDPPSMPIIHPEEIVGRTIGITQEDGQSTQLRIVEAIKEHQNQVESSPTNVKFRYNVNNNAYEDILTYNQILE